MKLPWSSALMVCLLISMNVLGATSGSDLSGRWEITTTYPGGSFVAGLDLDSHADKQFAGGVP
jgi:hypothetical protein